MAITAPTYTWGDIKTQIVFRLNRSDLQPDFVDTMGREVAQFYAPDIFPDGFTTDTSIITEPGQQFYQLPAGVVQVLFARFLYNGLWIPITLVDHYEDVLVSDVLQPPFTAIPILGRVYGNQIRLFPAPQAQYEIELTVSGKVEPPVGDKQSNFWTGDGRVLMINGTCKKICAEYIDAAQPDKSRVEMYQALETAAYNKLIIQTHASQSPMVIRQYN